MKVYNDYRLRVTVTVTVLGLVIEAQSVPFLCSPTGCIGVVRGAELALLFRKATLREDCYTWNVIRSPATPTLLTTVT